jgi:hypothetical protein
VDTIETVYSTSPVISKSQYMRTCIQITLLFEPLTGLTEMSSGTDYIGGDLAGEVIYSEGLNRQTLSY